MNKTILSVLVRMVVLLLCLAVLIGGTVYLIRVGREYAASKAFYESLAAPSGAEEPLSENAVPKEWQSLWQLYLSAKQQYPAVIGYIRISAVGISYPVVQGTDNSYYMSHLVSGEPNTSGSIFLDCSSGTVPHETKNMVIYGHNMNNKTMFHHLADLFDEPTFQNARVEYACEQGVFIYESFSVYVTTTSDRYYQTAFASDEVFLSFLQEAREKLFFGEREYSMVGTDEKCITLVTCSNSSVYPEQRYVYQGLLKEYYLFEKQNGEENDR